MINREKVMSSLSCTTKYLLNSVSQNGAWGIKDGTEWGPIITLMSVDYLIECGQDIDEDWIVYQDSPFECNLRRCLCYLDAEIQSDGAFGSDLWDACKLGELIERRSLHEYFTRYNLLKVYCIESIEQGNANKLDTDWSGTGIIVSCIEYLLYLNQMEKAKELFSIVVSHMQADGSFVGKRNKQNYSVVHPVWHVAQVVRLINNTPEFSSEPMNVRMLNWLINNQCDDGSFEYFSRFTYYYTGYGIIAYSFFPTVPDTNINQAISYLIGHVDKLGCVGDSGGTIMTILAFARLFSSTELNGMLEKAKAERWIVAVNDIKELIAENESLKKKLEEVKSKIASTEFTFTKKTVWILGIVITLLMLLLQVGVPVIMRLIFGADVTTGGVP